MFFDHLRFGPRTEIVWYVSLNDLVQTYGVVAGCYVRSIIVGKIRAAWYTNISLSKIRTTTAST